MKVTITGYFTETHSRSIIYMCVLVLNNLGGRSIHQKSISIPQIKNLKGSVIDQCIACASNAASFFDY